MSNIKKLKLASIAVAIILASIYLTFLIDAYTLNTWLKRAFIFCYFAIASCVCFCFYNKTSKRRYTLVPLICALVFVFIGQGLFMPTQAEHTICLESDENTASEVWFVDLKVDGKQESLSKLEINTVTGWTYSPEYDDYVFSPSQSTKENLLSFTVVGEEASLTFGSNSWSGKVRIFDEYGYDEILTLYSEDTSAGSVEHILNVKREYSVFQRIFYNTGAVIVLWFAFKVLFMLICGFGKKGGQSRCANLNVFTVYFLLASVFFKTLGEIYGITLPGVALFAVFAASLLLYPYAYRTLTMFKKMKIAEIILLFFVVFVVSFQTTAEIIFMKLDKVSVGFLDILTFIMAMALVAVPILQITLLIDKRTQKRFLGGEKIEKE